MAFKNKKSKLEPRRRRIATNTVADATPSKNVYSYNSRRGEKPEPRRKLKPTPAKKFSLAMFFAKGSSGLVVISLIVFAGYLLTLSPKPAVRSLGASGSFQIRNSDTYAKAAEEMIGSSLWSRSKLTINTKDIKAGLESEFPELASVNVVVPFFGNRPIVYIEPARPALVLVAANGTYVLDERGKVLINQANLPPSIKLGEVPTVNDQSNLNAELNFQALTGQDVTFIKTILGQLNAKGIKYTTLTLPAGASELDVQITGKPYFVKFNMQDRKHTREQAGTYFAVEQELVRKNITPSEYIDVRVEGRAYYK